MPPFCFLFCIYNNQISTQLVRRRLGGNLNLTEGSSLRAYLGNRLNQFNFLSLGTLGAVVCERDEGFPRGNFYTASGIARQVLIVKLVFQKWYLLWWLKQDQLLGVGMTSLLGTAPLLPQRRRGLDWGTVATHQGSRQVKQTGMFGSRARQSGQTTLPLTLVTQQIPSSQVS